MLIAVLLYKSSKLEKITNVHQKKNGYTEIQEDDGTLPCSERNSYWIHTMGEPCRLKNRHEVGFHFRELVEQAKLMIERSQNGVYFLGVEIGCLNGVV